MVLESVNQSWEQPSRCVLNEKMDGSKWLVHGKGVLDEGENESGSMYEWMKEREGEKVSLKQSCVWE